MLLRVLVINEELAVLAESVGLVAGDGDDVENAGTLLEDSVHLFEGSVGCFRVEEVDHWKDEGVAIGLC
jgi:hypothetical protein